MENCVSNQWCHIMWHLIWVCTVCLWPFYGFLSDNWIKEIQQCMLWWKIRKMHPKIWLCGLTPACWSSSPGFDSCWRPKSFHMVEFQELHKSFQNYPPIILIWLKYSRLSLSRSQRDPLKHFEISILRLIRCAELRKIPIKTTKFHKGTCNLTPLVRK